MKCNISKMQLDYEFGGQKSALDEAQAAVEDPQAEEGDQAEDSESEAEDAKGKSFEDEVCGEFAKELGL